MGDVNLVVANQTFTVPKELLTGKSHYFKAMFSGNYQEVCQDTVTLEVIDPINMEVILNYMQHGELRADTVSEMIDILQSATFLQVDSLINLLEQKLFELINCDTWLQIMTVAQEMTMKKLANTAELFGVFEFESMLDHVCVIQSFDKLHWYLNHPHLFVGNESQVFTFGEVWIYSFENQRKELIPDVIKWLDFEKLSLHDLAFIQKSDSLNLAAEQIVKCLIFTKSLENPYSVSDDEDTKQCIIKQFGEECWNVVCGMIKKKKRKGPNSSPAMVVNKNENGVDFLHRFNRKSAEFESYLRIGEGCCWGYSLCGWGVYKVVVACGEMGRGSGMFQRRVRVWNELLRKWHIHDIELPPRRHAAAVVHMDTLYLIGGIGSFRLVLSSGLSYNLKEQSWTNLPSLPEEIQSPSICVHRNEIYVGSFTKIYVLRDTWVPVVDLTFRPSALCSYGDSIFITRNFHKDLSSYNTEKKELCAKYAEYKLNVAGMCSIGAEIFAFTEDTDFRWEGGFCYIEWIDLKHPGVPKPKTIWSSDVDLMKYYAMPGCFPVVSISELYNFS